MNLQPYSFRDDDYGRVLVLNSAWTEEFEWVVKKHGVVGLDLNYALGFKGNDLSFLNVCTHLKSFYLTHLTIDNIEAVHRLGSLRQLSLETYAKSPIDFSCFPKLESCSFEWIKSSKSLFDCTKLQNLFVDKLPEKDLRNASKLRRLQVLRLYSASLESLEGIEALVNLRRIELAICRKLTSLHGIEHLSKLKRLEIESCNRIDSLDPISKLTNLRRLSMPDCGDIASLKPIRKLRKLEWVMFWGSTNIVDGDLSQLKELPRLERVVFVDRAHYSHGRTDFGDRFPR